MKVLPATRLGFIKTKVLRELAKMIGTGWEEHSQGQMAL